MTGPHSPPILRACPSPTRLATIRDSHHVVHSDSHQLSDRPEPIHAQPAAGENIRLRARGWWKKRSASRVVAPGGGPRRWRWSARRRRRRLWTRAWRRIRGHGPGDHSALQPDVQRQCAERSEQGECGNAHRGPDLTQFRTVDCSGGRPVLERRRPIGKLNCRRCSASRSSCVQILGCPRINLRNRVCLSLRPDT